MLRNYGPLEKLLLQFLSVNSADIACASESALRIEQTRSYFYQQLYTTLGDINAGKAFISHIFQTVLGYILTTNELPAEDMSAKIVSYILTLRQVGGGFLPIQNASRSGQLFSDVPEQTDIYATYYALSILELLERPAAYNVITELIDWLEHQRAESGWFYQLTLGDTREERKFQVELTLQTLYATLIFHNYDKLDINTLETTRDAIVQIHSRYMGVLYQSLYGLELLGGLISHSETIEVALDFVIRHFDEPSGGFFEYLFDEVKIDEIAGQKQRFQHDYLQPTISASYRALQILYLLRDDLKAREWWMVYGVKVQEYFTSNSPSAEGGFGSRLQIARFPTPFGPVTTPLETLMVICAPAILLTLNSSFL